MKKNRLLTLILILTLTLTACSGESVQQVVETMRTEQSETKDSETGEQTTTLSGENTGDNDYTGTPYKTLNDNQPEFTKKEKKRKKVFEKYSKLDSLGRCQVAYANIGKELMPTEERESIGMVKPSGWQTAKYDNVEGKYLYNRCHLIGYQLSGENANRKNLITGTRYMNTEGMLPFENQIAEYVKSTGNHVLYRVTPIYEDDDLVAKGVQMEAYSVEDKGKGVCFNVYAYNVQPGIEIDYATGESWQKVEENANTAESTNAYVLNTNTKKFHVPSCESASDTHANNRQDFTGTRQDLIQQGYEPCGRCQP